MTTTEQLVSRLTEALGDDKEVYLTCNAGKQDIKDVLALVESLERSLKVQESLNKDYLCVISYNNLVVKGVKVPPYEYYQKRTKEFLARSVESKSPKQKTGGTSGVDGNTPAAGVGA